ncbi:MAG: hypothetical protein AAGI63_08070 [Planctomycetota bacterium]
MVKSNLTRSPWWTRGGVAIVMASWATVQLVYVQTQGLNSWRGGGFGMYGGFHPVQNDAWVTTDEQPSVHYWKRSRDDSELFSVVRPHLTFPRKTALTDSLNELSSKSGKRYDVEITSPSLDLETLVLSRQPLLRTSSDGEP